VKDKAVDQTGSDKNAEPEHRKAGPKNGGHRPQAKVRARYALPTDRLTAEKQVRVLKAYVSASDMGAQGVSSQDVAPSAIVHADNVRKCLPFFSATGLIVADGRKARPAAELVEYFRQAEWAKPEEASAGLRLLLDDKWFLSAIKDALHVHGKLSRDAAVSVLCRAASCDRSDRVKIQTLLDMLKELGLTQASEDGSIVLGESSGTVAAQNPQEPPSEPNGGSGGGHGPGGEVSPQHPVKLNVDLKIDPSMTPENLRELLKVLKEELAWTPDGTQQDAE
jgi:hypothetical protein